MPLAVALTRHSPTLLFASMVSPPRLALRRPPALPAPEPHVADSRSPLRALRHALVSALCLSAAACATAGPRTPGVPPDVVPVRPPTPAATEPAIPLGDVAARPALATVSGEATYYASSLEGRPTASGVVFRNDAPFAAHREFPFGTILRVTNLRNGRRVLVEVVDRGPHGSSEQARRTILDVSQSAAAALGFIQQGRAPVQVDVLEWGGG